MSISFLLSTRRITILWTRTGPEAPDVDPKKLSKMVKKLKKDINEAAKRWDFERAAHLRDRLTKLEQMELTG